MRVRIKIVALLMYICLVGLGMYEMTAKSPAVLGVNLPGWQKAVLAENSTAWNPPTGILLVDKLLHESEEAARYYGFLATGRHLPQK